MDMGSTLMWTHAEMNDGFLLWSRMDTNCSHFLMPAPDAPGWHRVLARETIDAITGEGGEVEFQL
eukprot:5535478-Alexandrium_andersonii.AAC.1